MNEITTTEVPERNMIINKITYGYVVQAFDTEKQQFVSQSFYAGDKVEYETEIGELLAAKGIVLPPLEAEHGTIAVFPSSEAEQQTEILRILEQGKAMTLPFDMVQPEVKIDCSAKRPAKKK